MKTLIKILIIIIPLQIFATPQDPEMLIYKNDTLWIDIFPLEDLRIKNNLIDEKQKKLFKWSITTNWRGYEGVWKIENDSLFLTEIRHDDSYKKVNLNQIFDNSKISKKGVFAYWFSNVITTNYGEYLGTFEQDLNPIFSGKFSCIVKSGKVSSINIVYKQPKEIKLIKEKLQKESDTMICSVVEEYPVLLAKDREYDKNELDKFIKRQIQLPNKGKECDKKAFFKILVEKDGSASWKVIINDLSPACSKEAIRILNLMKKWKPGKINNKIVRTEFIVRFWIN